MSEKQKTRKERLEEEAREKKTSLIIRISLFLLILVGVAVSYLYKDIIEGWINFKLNGTPPSTELAVDDLVFHFVDVGQADAIVIEFPNDEVMLVDAGQDLEHRTESKNSLISFLSDNITLKEESGEKVIDYFVVTHPDFDHIATADDILEMYKIKNCFRPVMVSTFEDEDNGRGSATYADFIETLLKETGCNITNSVSGIELTIGGVSIEFLSPTPDDLVELESDNNERNNYSPIMIFTYQGKKVMLTGDAEKEVEENVLEYYNSNLSKLDVDVLKLGHHGSDTSSTIEFLRKVTPKYAIICVGEDNSYGHPKPSTLDNLNLVGVLNNDIYRTDLNGSISLSVSDLGEIAIVCGYVQYTTTEIKWWYLAVGVIVVFAIIIFLPATLRKEIKKTIRRKINSKKPIKRIEEE